MKDNELISRLIHLMVAHIDKCELLDKAFTAFNVNLEMLYNYCTSVVLR